MRSEYEKTRNLILCDHDSHGLRVKIFDMIFELCSKELPEEQALICAVEYLNEIFLAYSKTKQLPIFNDFKRICTDLCRQKSPISYDFSDTADLLQTLSKAGRKDKFLNDINTLLINLFGEEMFYRYLPIIKNYVSYRNHEKIIKSSDKKLKYFYILLISLTKKYKRSVDIRYSEANSHGIDYLSLLYSEDFDKSLLFCLGPESLGKLIDTFGGTKVYVPKKSEVEHIKQGVLKEMGPENSYIDNLLKGLERNFEYLSTSQIDKLEQLIANRKQ